MIQWILALFSCFMIQIKNVYLVNILFVLIVAMGLVSDRRLHIINKAAKNWFVLYILWSAISMIAFALEYKELSLRNLLQFAFNFQYIFWIISIPIINKDKLKKCIQYMAYALAIVIIVLWIKETHVQNPLYILVRNRMWAAEFLSGWPNIIVLPIVFSIYLTVKDEEIGKLHKIFAIILMIFSLILCTSRAGLLGGILIIAYF